jgi:hypothetical protein
MPGWRTVDLPIYSRGSWKEDLSLAGIDMRALSYQLAMYPERQSADQPMAT